MRRRRLDRFVSAAAPVKRLGTSACPLSVASKAAVYVLDEAGYVKVRDWCKQAMLAPMRTSGSLPDLAEFKTSRSWKFWLKSTPNLIGCTGYSGSSVERHADYYQDIEERQEARVYCGVEAGPFGNKEVPHPLGTVPAAIHPVQLQNIVPVEVSDVLVVGVWLSVDREISGYAQSRDGTRLFIHDRYIW